MLPPDKKAVVLSVDDLSYYHSYKPAGFPERLVLDDNGDVKCLCIFLRIFNALWYNLYNDHDQNQY